MTKSRPHFICHMVSSVDGKIDGKALQPVMRKGEYEELGSKLRGDAWICGRTTSTSQRMSRLSQRRTYRQDLSPSMSLAAPTRMRYRSIPLESSVGRAAISMVITSSACSVSECRQIISQCFEKRIFPTSCREHLLLTLLTP